jgi:hypothetical protein
MYAGHADGHARGGEPAVAGGIHGARDAEVGDHRTAAARVEQDVVRLDVAMDHAAIVGVGERVGHFAQHLPRFVDREHAALVQALREVVAAHIRHDEEDELLDFVDGVDRNDVGVRELRRRLRLAEKAGLDLAAKRQLGRKQLDRDLPFQPAVLGTIDDAHAAPSDLAVELVVGRKRALDMGAELVIRGRGERVGHATTGSQGET